ncbi:hypothetical protein C8Q76DRAFT_784663 [Earliella scabrosa]|nr:hypothetical protein C8Q76DRAFT_784663 [Earliella scabrosa]
MARTCGLCRERAVKCDGLQPTCGPCADFGATVTCDYSSRASGPSSKTSNLLQKGAACLPCRKKKKKCDAKRPYCSTCTATGKNAHCVYEEDAQRALIHSLVQRTQQLEQRLATAESLPASIPNPHYTVPSLTGAAFHFPINISVNSLTPPVANVPVPLLCQPAHRTTVQQIRDFRLVFISYSAHNGVKLRPEAIDALMRGDFYSPYIHPVLIHAAQLSGCMIWQELNGTQSPAATESFELEATLSFLTNDTPTLVTLQVRNILATYFFVRKRFSDASKQITLASDLVLRHGLRFISPSTDMWDPLLEAPHEIEELVCALSQLLHMNIDRYMVLGVPSELGPEYEEEFNSLSIMYPTLARTYLTIIRARGALLLHRTLQLSLRFRAQPSTPWHSQPHTQDTALLAQYWQLVDEVEQHLANLNPALLKASLHPDQHPSTIGLKVCLIATLTAAVELHHLAPSTHVESRQGCLNAVLKLVGIVKTCTMKGHELLDPILGVCWMTAAQATFEESARAQDEHESMNWTIARAVLVACVPVLAKSLPYWEVPLNQILQRASSFHISS